MHFWTVYLRPPPKKNEVLTVMFAALVKTSFNELYSRFESLKKLEWDYWSHPVTRQQQDGSEVTEEANSTPLKMIKDPLHVFKTSLKTSAEPLDGVRWTLPR